MANVLVENSSLQDIADSIRAKLGVQTTYKPGEMAAAIDTIGGGGITPTGTKSITANGTNIDVAQYAYADVAVPNSYAAGDEGKVVSNGALVAQTAHAEVTQNGTIDTTLNNSVTVNVSGGGGGGGVPIAEFEVTPESKSAHLTFPDGGFTIPPYYVMLMKSSLTAGDGVSIIIKSAYTIKTSQIPTTGKTSMSDGDITVFKSDGITEDYYNAAATITQSGGNIDIFSSNARYFLNGTTYKIQFYTLDSTFV